MLESYDQVVQEYTFRFSKEVALRIGEKLIPQFIEFKGRKECEHEFKRTEVKCPSEPSFGELKYLIFFDLCIFCLKGFVEFVPNKNLARLVVSS